MTSEKIFYGVLALIFALVSVAAYEITSKPEFGILFGIMSFVSLVKCLDIGDWFTS